MSFFQSEAQLPQPHPDCMMADAEGLLEFFEGGVGILFDMSPEFLRVEFAPMTPDGFWRQRPRLYGVQIAVNSAPTFASSFGAQAAPSIPLRKRFGE